MTSCPLAVKICKFSDELTAESVKQEFEILKDLDHTSIPKVFKLYKQPQRLYLVMQRAEGITLDKYVV